MSNQVSMLTMLFTAGIFMIGLFTFVVLLIDKIK